MFDDSKPGPKPKKKHLAYTPEVLTELPEVPDHLTPGARAHWLRCAAPLVGAGLLCKTDLPALSELAEELRAVEGMRARAEADGWAVTQPNGCICKHPLLQDIDRAGKRIAVLFKALGMTPEGRAALPPVETQPISSLFVKDNYPAAGRWAHLKPDAAGRIPGKPGYDPETA